MRALAIATREATQKAQISGEQAARRILSLVRSPVQSRGSGDHRSGAPGRTPSDSMVRRGVFLRVGLRKVVALAPSQSGET
jgi:hypothetical protein